jgi:hypothetical protein
VVRHHATCVCVPGYTGNPFDACAAVVEGQFELPSRFFMSNLSLTYNNNQMRLPQDVIWMWIANLQKLVSMAIVVTLVSGIVKVCGRNVK